MKMDYCNKCLTVTAWKSKTNNKPTYSYSYKECVMCKTKKK